MDDLRQEIDEVLTFVAGAAADYLAQLDARPVHEGKATTWAESFGGPLPEAGDGALGALTELQEAAAAGAVHSAGPRFFHFVIGGGTPAAVGADMMTAVLDQNAGMWTSSPLGARLETVALSWLRQLFELPVEWGGVLTTGATMANFTGLAAARRWWGQQHGRDVDRDGLAALPPTPVFSSGYIHSSAIKALGMLGIGRRTVRVLASDDAGRLDAEALKRELEALEGAPAIVIANAGEVNTGDFDPIAAVADLCDRYNAWLHVDGAFGLFARISERTAHLTEGIERARSVIADGHKWLNVPYDCGFAFVRDASLLPGVFTLAAAYLTGGDDERPNFGFMGPESSRRARALPVWATLRAYGRAGNRAIVDRHLDLAQHVARVVDEAPDLERLADVPLNIVCFRYRPEGVSESRLDELNARLGEAVLEDGRVFVGTTVYRGRVAFRPAIVNWRSSEKDVELLVEVIRELGRGMSAEGTSTEAETGQV